MNAFAILIGLVVGLIVGTLVATRKRRRPYLATSEYWVYIPGTTLPPQEQIMHRMLAQNPYGTPANPPVGPREGVLFSDVRTHIALVLRSKNPHIFRPDHLSDDVIASPEQLAALESSQALVKVRYVSESPLADKRHLTFLAHATDAIAELGNAQVIYDTVAERLLDAKEMRELLSADPTGASADVHLNLSWRKTGEGGYAETKGLEKIGLDNLLTVEMEGDERVIVSEVLAAAAASIWNQGSILPDFEVNAFDDLFKLHSTPSRGRKTVVRIMRVQPI